VSSFRIALSIPKVLVLTRIDGARHDCAPRFRWTEVHGF
jgi:hypothetical protein